MGEGQDRQDAVEGEVVPVAGPTEEPANDTLGTVAAEGSAPEDSPQDDAEGGAGLTGILAALGEPEPETAISEPEPADLDAEVASAGTAGVASQIVDAEQADPEIAALQADLETEKGTAEVAAGEIESVAAPEPQESLDDIAPAIVGGEQDAAEDAKDIALPDDRTGVPVWPFLVYFALWVVFAGLLVWQFMQAPPGTPIYELYLYGLSILAGLFLTALGPLLAIAVWLALWLARPGRRAGLFSRSLIIGAVTTLAGVALWLIALGALDMLRLGRLL